MNDADSLNGSETDSNPDGGILAALPRTRPQRPTARRTAARSGRSNKALSTEAPATTRANKKQRPKQTAGKDPAAAEKPAAAKKPAETKKAAETKKPIKTKKPTTRPIAKPVEPPTPKQGYEPEEEVELGATVHPPSSAELFESVVDIVGEMAGSSLAAGGRLLKDAFSLLRRS